MMAETGHAVTDDRPTFGGWLTRMREHPPKTNQQDLATRLHVAVASVRRWEKDEVRPLPAAQVALARFARRKGFAEPMPE